MNNIELIQEDYSVGDSIRISCSLGIKEGVIIAFLEDRIKLRPYEKGRKPFSVQNSTITDWEEGPNDTESKNNCDVADTQTLSNLSYTIDNADAIPNSGTESSPKIEQSQVTTNDSTDHQVSPSIAGDEGLHEIQSEEQPSIGVKLVGTIPYDQLLQIDPKIGKKKKKMTPIGKDLSALSALVTETDLRERGKYVPARGTIAIAQHNYGFIDDAKTNKRIYFSASQIVDPEIQLYKSVDLPVAYQVIEGDKGLQAVGIHKPSQVGRLLDIANELMLSGDKSKALWVLDNILASFPENSEVLRIYNCIRPTKKETDSATNYYGNFYRKAEQANHIQKNYELAIDLYTKAIESGDRTESAIKDLVMLLLALYKKDSTKDNLQRAVSTLKKYKPLLPSQNLSNLNFLRGFYFSIEAFDEYDKILDIMFEHPLLIDDHKKRSMLFTEEAFSFIKRNDLENAQAAVDDALGEDPYYSGALKLQQIIADPQIFDVESVEGIFSASDFNQLSNGLSLFIQNTLDEYSEYYGVPESIKVDPSKFSQTTLKGIKGLIEKVGKGRSRERAKYLLTAAKLVSILDCENIKELNEYLILYCNSMASAHLADESHMDVVRFYYNEAFALSKSDYSSLATQVSNALLTYIYSSEQILTQKNKTIPVSEVINIVSTKLKSNILWDALLEISLNNREISAHVVEIIFKSKQLKADAIQYLNNCHDQKCSSTCNEEAFGKAWNSAREHRINESVIFENKFRLPNLSTLEYFPQLFADVTNDIPQWVPSLDSQRINSIRDRVVPALGAYLKSSGYRNKETNYSILDGLLVQLIAEIDNQPTQISYNSILPLAKTLKSLLDSSFNDIKMASEPKLTVTLLSTETAVTESNIVSFQVSVENDKASSPVRQIHVSVKEDDGILSLPLTDDVTDYNALEGGDVKVYKLSIRVSPSHIEAQALPISIRVQYDASGIKKETVQQISLKLYSAKDFVPITNHYAPLADGGPVDINSNMFFGRKKFIEDIVTAFRQTSSKQVIIYGQKRCGKSSVLLHIKDALQKDGNFFCVQFSLGDIVKNLTEFSFYHKIITSIEWELETWSLDYSEEPVPEFTAPTIDEFKSEDAENPLNTFIKYIRKFKNECRKLGGRWSTLNLVVMIDEFTYIYTGIRKGDISDSIMKQWKAITQNPQTQFSVVLVGQDVIPSFKKEDYARNAFGVIKDIRLTYLLDAPARELIEKPIYLPTGTSRYVGRAVDRIIEYTSRNPYYIQIFCARLVDYLNENKSIYITEADVNAVAGSFIKGEQALDDDKFDNLIRPGESEELQEFKDKDVLSVLRQMASLSNNIGFCRIQDLDSLNDSDLTSRILDNLVDREVIERIDENKYKIQVKLFQEWLLNH